MEKGKFLGYCQACGAQQVVAASGTLAKHGYQVAGFGYFKGVCQGSKHQPLELERSYLDETVAALADYATEADALAADLKSGKRHPVTVAKRAANGNREYAPRKGFEARVPLTIEWQAASKMERMEGVAENISLAKREADHARAHIVSLAALATRAHGQPLTARKLEQTPLAVGDTVRLFGKSGYDATILEIVGKVAQGCGPALNGHHIPHIRYEKEGASYFYPLRLIRRPKAGA